MGLKSENNQDGGCDVNAYLESFGEPPEEGRTPELEKCAKAFLELLDYHGFTVKDAVCLLDPISRLRLHTPAAEIVEGKKNRTKRLKAWTNPHTGEVVYSKAGNLVILREWRKQYGADAVLSWKS
ncbi:hypothetical protein ACSQ5K_14715 [Pseudomonas sp. PhalM4]